MTSTSTIATTTASTWTLRAPGVDEDLVVTVGTATHAGDLERNADAVDVEYFATAGTVAAAVLDGKGTSVETVKAMQACAAAAVRIGARRGPVPGLTTAAEMLADFGPDFVPVDGVGAIAVVRPGRPVKIAHVGRARAYSWSGSGLVRLTEDQTHGQQLRERGRTEQEAAAEDRLQRVTLARCSMSTVQDKITEDEVVLLTTHYVHDVLDLDHMAAIVRERHHAGAGVVAEAILHAALEAGVTGSRGNASVVAIILSHGHVPA